ncbi:MAG: hypothetical protein U0Q07_11125 [Acidimicrobiales bacterium]
MDPYASPSAAPGSGRAPGGSTRSTKRRHPAQRARRAAGWLAAGGTLGLAAWFAVAAPAPDDAQAAGNQVATQTSPAPTSPSTTTPTRRPRTRLGDDSSSSSATTPSTRVQPSQPQQQQQTAPRPRTRSRAS